MSNLPYHEKPQKEIEAMKIYQKRYREKDKPRYLLKQAKASAKKRGLDFSITKEDIVIPDKCPVFDIEFGHWNDTSASLDRIDNSVGYIPGNIQVISKKANRMKNNATQEELKRFAQWALST